MESRQCRKLYAVPDRDCNVRQQLTPINVKTRISKLTIVVQSSYSFCVWGLTVCVHLLQVSLVFLTNSKGGQSKLCASGVAYRSIETGQTVRDTWDKLIETFQIWFSKHTSVSDSLSFFASSFFYSFAMTLWSFRRARGMMQTFSIKHFPIFFFGEGGGGRICQLNFVIDINTARSTPTQWTRNPKWEKWKIR